MALWDSLKSSVISLIYSNTLRLITGDIHQAVDISIITQLGAHQFKGIATPSTVPGTPDGAAWYLASTNGDYSSFGLITLTNEIAAIKWDGSTWAKTTLHQKGSYIPDDSIGLNHLTQAVLDYIQTNGGGGSPIASEVFLGTFAEFNAAGDGAWDNIKVATFNDYGSYKIQALGTEAADGRIVRDEDFYQLRKILDVDKDIFYFDTISDLKSGGSNLPSGLRVFLIGNATALDGGGNFYRIDDSSETGDDYNIIEITGVAKRAKLINTGSLDGGGLGF